MLQDASARWRMIEMWQATFQYLWQSCLTLPVTIQPLPGLVPRHRSRAGP